MNRIKLLILILLAVSARLNASGEWQVISKMPIPVKGGQAIVHDSRIYIIGGYSDSLYEALSKIQIYDPLKNSWEIFDDTLDVKRYGLSADNYRHEMIIFGGAALPTAADSALEMWDFSNSPYTFDSDFIFSRKFATAQVHENSIFIFGGFSEHGYNDTDSSSYLVEYHIPNGYLNFRSNGFFDNEPTGQLPVQQMSALSGDDIFIFGGAYNGILTDINRFNIPSKTWEPVAFSMCEERAAGAAVSVTDDTIVIIGGYNEFNHSLRSVEVFKPFESTSCQYFEHSLIHERSELMAACLDGFIYVFGGENSLGQVVGEVEKVDFSGQATPLRENTFSPPSNLQLKQNYPNPFNPSTVIPFRNDRPRSLSLKIYSVDGTLIRTIYSGSLDAGAYHFHWNGRDTNGMAVASGIYIYQLSCAEWTLSKRLVLIR